MWDWLSTAATSAGNWLGKADNLKNLGTLASAGGSIYSGIKQNNMANKMYDMEKTAFDIGVAKDKETKETMDSVWSNQKKKKPKTAFDLNSGV